MKLQHTLALTLPMLSSWAVAADLTVKFDLPQLDVAAYHRPYVAAWIERADQGVAGTLAVWYDVKTKNNPEGEGTKWLKDLRQWWRRIGRELTMPVDGVSSATRPAGKHQINATESDAQLYARLASSVLYANAALRADAGVLMKNRRGQSGLWGYAISGDLPIVLARIGDAASIDLVRQLVQAHAYWRLKGLAVDLVIWNEDHAGYRQLRGPRVPAG